MSSPFKGAPREVSGCCGESAGSVLAARVHDVVACMRAPTSQRRIGIV